MPTVRVIIDSILDENPDITSISILRAKLGKSRGLLGATQMFEGGLIEIIVSDDLSNDQIKFIIIKELLHIVSPESQSFDLLISELAPQTPKVFVSDMDSTMIAAECIDELADFAGLKPQIAAITERAMQGELDFVQALTERVRLLEGLDEDAIQQCLAERIAPMPGARVLVQTLKSLGCHTVLVTGGFHQFADPVAEQLGFEEVVGNRLEIADGKLTGGLIGNIVDSAVKERVLRDAVARLGGPSLATGDGANDIPMLQAATYGIAYHAKPKARAAAGGTIDRGDLTSVLRLLGIAEGDWVFA